MKIGIYKPFKKVYFHDDAEDNAAWSYEVVHVAKMLESIGHTIFMLSESDLGDHEPIRGISQGSIDETYGRIIIWSGSFQLDINGEQIIARLRNQTPRLDFMLTDLRLVPEDKHLYNYFDVIYTQATRTIVGIPLDKQLYGGVAEFLPYQHQFTKPVLESIMSKKTEYYFGGTERGRLDDFLEYCWRPDCKLTTKSAFVNVENRVDRHEYKRLLDDTKYSIVIADVEYNKNHFITPRPYEYFMHDIVCFVDNKYDPDGHIIPLDSWLRVSSYKEMKAKMDEMSHDVLAHQLMINWQREQITPELVSGKYVLDRIMN